MKLKIRQITSDGLIRIETQGTIKEVMINEDFFDPKSESIAIGFRGKSGSGLVELSYKELEEIYKQVQPRMHLVKGFKMFKTERGEGPI